MPDIYRALSFLCMHISLQYLVPWATCCTINQTLPNDVTRDPEVLVPKTQGPGCPAEGTECLIASLWTFRLRRASPLEKAYFKSSCRHLNTGAAWGRKGLIIEETRQQGWEWSSHAGWNGSLGRDVAKAPGPCLLVRTTPVFPQEFRGSGEAGRMSLSFQQVPYIVTSHVFSPPLHFLFLIWNHFMTAFYTLWCQFPCQLSSCLQQPITGPLSSWESSGQSLTGRVYTLPLCVLCLHQSWSLL